MRSRIPIRRAWAVTLVLLGTVGGGWLVAATWKADRDIAGAARGLLDSLSDTQRAKMSLPYATPERAQWHYIPKPERRGLPIAEMNEQQRGLAQRLLRTTLSDIGYGKAQRIMELEKILRALEPTKPPGFRDPQRYFFAVYGAPADAGRWQWSVEGHHLSLNFVVERGKVVSHTPAFFGANPAIVKADVGVGPKKGTRVLALEETLAFELLHAFSADQARKCLIAEKAPKDISAGGKPQPVVDAPAGLPLAAMTAQQQDLFLALIRVYFDNLSEDIATQEWHTLQAAGVEKLYFAWAGAKEPGIGHYYRIQGPMFVIELCNTQPDGAGNPANHVHTVLRHLQGDFALPLGATSHPAAPGRSVAQTVLGRLPDGSPVDVYTLTNPHGLEARLMTLGATLLALRVPDRDGKLEHVVLHPETLDECQHGFPLGSVIGRFANRIADARFSIDGQEFKLTANAGKHHCHGGGKKDGFQSQLWQAQPVRESDAVGVEFRLLSPDGQAGYPGAVQAVVIYRLTDRNELSMEYTATTDRPTHVNLTNHAYWNLAGAANGDVLNHVLTLHADQYLASDAVRMPTGEFRAVQGTPLDFTAPHALGSRMEQVDGKIYDHCYVLRTAPGQSLALAARVVEPTSGRCMEVFTTQPGLQLYTGNRRALCLETQHFPNAPNEPKFPSTLLRPGATYHQMTVHKFSVVKPSEVDRPPGPR